MMLVIDRIVAMVLYWIIQLRAFLDGDTMDAIIEFYNSVGGWMPLG